MVSNGTATAGRGFVGATNGRGFMGATNGRGFVGATNGRGFMSYSVYSSLIPRLLALLLICPVVHQPGQGRLVG